MLVGDGFVIASPTKTGTRSLVHLARSNPELGLRYVPAGHRMTVPEEFVGYTRHMIVRDPFARMVSIYGYLRRRGEMLAHVLGIAPWIERFLDQRRSFRPETYNAMAPSIWLATQAECWRQLRGDRFWKLEAIGDFLAAVNIRAELPRVNVGTPGEIPTECRERVWREWAREDCSMFGYARA